MLDAKSTKEWMQRQFEMKDSNLVTSNFDLFAFVSSLLNQGFLFGYGKPLF